MAGLASADVRVGEAEALGAAGSEVLGHDVDVLGELQDELAGRGRT